MTPELILLPRRSAILKKHGNVLDVLVRIQAPSAPEQAMPRSPLNLSIVLDRSGSMGGSPLREAIRCARFMIERMQPTDRASIVTYDNTVNVLVPSQPVGNRAPFLHALKTISSGGSTDLHGGWLAGSEQAATHLSTNSISRVLLLSDGRANHGITDPDQITSQCTALANAGVSTSTYGLGQNFNEDLMGEMARAGQGNSYYGQRAEDLMDPFQEEFDLLAALFARQVRLSLHPAPGVTARVLNGYAQDDGAWILPDLAFDGEAWAMVQLQIPEHIAAQDHADLLTASVSMTELDGAPLHASRSLRLPALPPAAFSVLSEDSLVRQRMQELEAARYQEDARQAALRGDWARVQTLLAEAQAKAADNEWLKQSLAVLEKYAQQRQRSAFTKEAYYSSRKMRRRLTSAMELDWSDEEEGPSYFRRKREQGRRQN